MQAMKKSPSWSLVCLVALTAALAGCATEPAGTKTASESCTGVAPPTGSMLRKKDDCAAEKSRTPMTEAEIQELKMRNGALNPRGGAGNAQ